MYGLELIGLILLCFLIVLGGRFYLKHIRPRIARKRLPPVIDAPEEKFETAVELGPEFVFPPEPVREEVPDLPASYDDSRITIMARDPEWIFTYWDIGETRQNELRNIYGPDWDNGTSVLRVYDVTGIDYFNGSNHNGHYDIIVNESAGSWYINVGFPDRSYCVDLGRFLPDGTYIVIARSNITSTPRNTISDQVDPDWMLVSENERKLLGRLGLFGGLSSIDLFEGKSH